MGKKSKRAGKAGGDTTAGGGKSAAKTKQGPGKARRERAAAQREVQARLDALIAKLEEELRDVELFGPLEEREECPVCFVPMPLDLSHWSHPPCCSKIICHACARAAGARRQFNCAFCRAPVSGDEALRQQQLRKRIESGDTWAMYILANNYKNGNKGLPKDDIAAMNLWLQAAELGHLPALCSISGRYVKNEFEVRTTKEQALKLAKAAAKKGSVRGHHLLGWLEFKEQDNLVKARNHFVHAAIGGWKESLEMLKIMQRGGMLDQDTFDDIEVKHNEALALEWSEERDKVNTKDGVK